MKISIIVPVYNAEKYLKKCIESLINQTYKDIEVILIDDGSSDSSLSICNVYAQKDNRVKVFSQENSGPSVARNIGLENAIGAWVMFVDSDDYVKPDICEKLYYKALETHSDMVICNLCTIFSDEKTEQSVAFYDIQKEFQEAEIFELEKMIVSRKTETGYGLAPFVGPVCKLIHKEAIEGERFPEKMDYGEDTCFVLSILKNMKRVTYMNDVLYMRIARDGSLSRGFDINLADRMKKFVNWVTTYYKDDVKMQRCLKRFQICCIMSVVDNYFGTNSKEPYFKGIRKVKQYIIDTEYNVSIHDIFKEDFGIFWKLILLFVRFRVYWLIKVLYKIRYMLKKV